MSFEDGVEFEGGLYGRKPEPRARPRRSLWRVIADAVNGFRARRDARRNLKEQQAYRARDLHGDFGMRLRGDVDHRVWGSVHHTHTHFHHHYRDVPLPVDVPKGSENAGAEVPTAAPVEKAPENDGSE